MPTIKQCNVFREMVRERYWRQNDLLPSEYERAKPPQDYKRRIAAIVVSGPEHADQEELNASMQWMKAFKGCGQGNASETYEQIRRSLTMIKMSTAHHTLYTYFIMNPSSNIDDAAKELEIQATTAKYQAFDLLRVRAMYFKDGELKVRTGLNIVHEPKRGRTCELVTVF